MAGGANSLIAAVDLSGLESLFDDLGDAAEEAARPAAQAAAQVFYDTAKANVSRIKKLSGNLDKAIYQAFSPENSGQGVAEYHINGTQRPRRTAICWRSDSGSATRWSWTRKGWVTLARRRAPARRSRGAVLVRLRRMPTTCPALVGRSTFRARPSCGACCVLEPAAVLASADVLWQALGKVK